MFVLLLIPMMAFTLLFKEIFLKFKTIDYSFKRIDFLMKLTYLSIFYFVVLVQLGFLIVLYYLKYDVAFFELVCTLQVFISIIATAVLYRIKKDLE